MFDRARSVSRILEDKAARLKKRQVQHCFVGNVGRQATSFYSTPLWLHNLDNYVFRQFLVGVNHQFMYVFLKK